MSAPKPPGLKVIASLNLKRAGDWTPEYRREVASWLRRQAKMLVSDGANYSPRFSARKMGAK